MRTFFNEFDRGAAQWLRELIRDGLISEGVVDERSITELASDDVRGFGRAHFFAGIGGWELALQLAGWPAGRDVWTGSCPCQPYSSAGKRKGNADERDLWPDFFRLIRECRPQCVFGEQVEAAVRHGWLDRVRADMEREGYTVGACVRPVHSVGAPHIRQRLFWVAHTEGEQQRDRFGRAGDDAAQLSPCGRGATGTVADADGSEPGSGQLRLHAIGGSGDGLACVEERAACVVADAHDNGASTGVRSWQPEAQRRSVARGVFHPASNGREQGRAEPDGRHADATRDAVGVALGDANSAGPQGRGVSERERAGECVAGASGGVGDFWADSRLVHCRDGEARRVPIEPALFPLADGFPGRVGILRGAGNAIVPQLAAQFIAAFLEAEG